MKVRFLIYYCSAFFICLFFTVRLPAAPQHFCLGTFSHSKIGSLDITHEKGGIEKHVYDRVLDRIEEVFAPEIESRGFQLIVERLWSEDLVNAFAPKDGNIFRLQMYGGLARYPHTTVESFILTTCHEIGHFLGGAPRVGENYFWLPTEGQADYFSTLKCIPMFFDGIKGDDISLFGFDDFEVDEIPKTQCDEVYTDATERKVCYYSSMAAMKFALLDMQIKSKSELVMAALGHIEGPRFDTPDPTVVDKTLNGHPSTQCRLDTMVSGALCSETLDIWPDYNDHTKGNCTIYPDGQLGAARPPCWFRDPNLDILSQ